MKWEERCKKNRIIGIEENKTKPAIDQKNFEERQMYLERRRKAAGQDMSRIELLEREKKDKSREAREERVQAENTETKP